MMPPLSTKKYPCDSKDYKLYEEVGNGVSATVYRAVCVPFNEIVAIKVLDLERCNNDLDGIRGEVRTMTLIDHPNVLRAHCSFTAGSDLWVVMPYMAGGSCLHIMKSTQPKGFEQPVIATLLREVLKALVYLHSQGHIHRDVKAGNILVDSNGAVKLADFGVSACMFDTGDRQRSRNTFVGTPCWMAPEVMRQLHGYNFKADIWSFGITALELARGHAPFSKYPPMKVLLMTLQNAPPGLDYERDKKFSKSFKELVAACLVKNPKKRPTSEKLLKHHFFKHAQSNDFLARSILKGLPLHRSLKENEAALFVLYKAICEDEKLSQQMYMRGISAWNFDLEDLKRQADLIQENDVSENGEQKLSFKNEKYDNKAWVADMLSDQRICNLNSAPFQEDWVDGPHVESSPASLPIHDDQGPINQLFKDPQGDADKLQLAEDEQGESLPQKGCLSAIMPGIPKRSSNGLVNTHFGGSSTPTVNSASVLSTLRCILQQNIVQREEIKRLIRYVHPYTESTEAASTRVAGTNERQEVAPVFQGEKNLQSQKIQTQQSVGRFVEELQRIKLQNALMERQLKALVNKK